MKCILQPGWKQLAGPLTALGYLLVLSHLTLAPNPWWIFGSVGREAEGVADANLPDFIQHTLAYALLGLLMIWGAHSARQPIMIGCVIAAVLHAVGSEWLQQYIPRRVCDPIDGLANLVGVAIGLAMAAGIVRAMSVVAGDKPRGAFSSARSQELEDAIG